MFFNGDYGNNYQFDNYNFSSIMDNDEDLDRYFDRLHLNDFPLLSITDENDENDSNFQFSHNYNTVPSPINDTNQSNQETAPRTRAVHNINFNIKNNKRVKDKIFVVKKVNKNLGRKRANSAHKNDDDKDVHTKYSDDNIRKVITRKLSNHIKTYENNLLKKSHNSNLKSLELFKVNSSFINVHKKEDFLALLDTPTKDLLSNEVSKKYLESKKDNNKIAISKILGQNDKTLNYSLDLTFEDMLHIYISKKRKSIFKDFPYIEKDMEIMKAKGHDENYVNKYKFYAEHFREKIQDIDGRKRRRNENED